MKDRPLERIDLDEEQSWVCTVAKGLSQFIGTYGVEGAFTTRNPQDCPGIELVHDPPAHY